MEPRKSRCRGGAGAYGPELDAGSSRRRSLAIKIDPCKRRIGQLRFDYALRCNLELRKVLTRLRPAHRAILLSRLGAHVDGRISETRNRNTGGAVAGRVFRKGKAESGFSGGSGAGQR